MAKLVELIISTVEDHRQNSIGVTQIFTKEGKLLCEINPLGGDAKGDYDLFKSLLESK